MRKSYSAFIIFIILNILFLSANPAFAVAYRGNYFPHFHNGKFYTKRSSNDHKPYDYDLEFLNNTIKHDRKIIKSSEKYIVKIKRPEFKKNIQNVIDNHTKEAEQLELLRKEWYDK